MARNWQTHRLTLEDETLRKVKEEGCQPIIVTGTIVEDPTGKFRPGWHFRSTLVKEIDRENGILVTRTKTYKLEGEEGTDIVPDLGNNVLSLFY